MGRVLKYLVIVIVLAAGGLYGYSFVLTPETASVTQEITLNVD